MKIDSKICDKEFDNLLKWEEILLKQIGEEKKIKRVYKEYIKALSTYYVVMFEQYYREGFICGAQVAMEICGINIPI